MGEECVYVWGGNVKGVGRQRMVLGGVWLLRAVCGYVGRCVAMSGDV